MNNEYIGLALCNVKWSEKLQLFQIPAFYSSIEVGDEVVVDTGSAMVVFTSSVIYGSDEYKMILALAGASHPLKRVLMKIQYKELDYKDEIVLEDEDDK